MNLRGNCAQSRGRLAQPKASVIVYALFRNGEILRLAGHGMPVVVQSLRALNTRANMSRGDGRDAALGVEELFAV